MTTPPRCTSNTPGQSIPAPAFRALVVFLRDATGAPRLALTRYVDGLVVVGEA